MVNLVMLGSEIYTDIHSKIEMPFKRNFMVSFVKMFYPGILYINMTMVVEFHREAYGIQ